MMRKVVQLATLLCLAFSSYKLMAVDQLTGEPEVTGFTGNEGAVRTLSKPVAENDAIFGVEMAEKGDDPCYLRVRYRDVTTGEERASKVFAECDDSNENTGRDATRVYATLPDTMLVTGASICLNARRDKLKGIELKTSFRECVRGESSATVATDLCTRVFRPGTMEHRLCSSGNPRYQRFSCNSGSSISRYVERPNCRGTNRGPDLDWEKVINCPPKTVATGFRLSTRRGGGNRTLIDGLALECAPLTSDNKEIAIGKSGQI